MPSQKNGLIPGFLVTRAHYTQPAVQPHWLPREWVHGWRKLTITVDCGFRQMKRVSWNEYEPVLLSESMVNSTCFHLSSHESQDLGDMAFLWIPVRSICFWIYQLYAEFMHRCFIQELNWLCRRHLGLVVSETFGIHLKLTSLFWASAHLDELRFKTRDSIVFKFHCSTPTTISCLTTWSQREARLG